MVRPCLRVCSFSLFKSSGCGEEELGSCICFGWHPNGLRTRALRDPCDSVPHKLAGFLLFSRFYRKDAVWKLSFRTARPVSIRMRVTYFRGLCLDSSKDASIVSIPCNT